MGVEKARSSIKKLQSDEWVKKPTQSRTAFSNPHKKNQRAVATIKPERERHWKPMQHLPT
jgi:hypothetical protein